MIQKAVMLSWKEIFSHFCHVWLNLVQQQWSSDGMTANYKSIVLGSLTYYYSIK